MSKALTIINKETECIPVFVYGTLLSGQGNWSRHLAPTMGTPAILRQYEMYSLGGYPGIIASREKGICEIRGEVYHISPEELVKMDNLEGYSGISHNYNLYNRKVVMVELIGEDENIAISCFVYVYNTTQQLPNRIEDGDWKKFTEGIRGERS